MAASDFRPRQSRGTGKPRGPQARTKAHHQRHMDHDETIVSNEPVLLPQSDVSERALIGAALSDERSLETCANVRPKYFFRHAHQLIWEAAQDLHAAHVPVDYISVSELLTERGTLEEVGGLDTLVAYATELPPSGHAPAWADTICKRYYARFMLSASAKMAEVAYRGDYEEMKSAYALQYLEQQEVLTALGITGEGAAQRFAFMTDEEVEALPDPDWLIHEVLVENSVSVAFGDYGSGKSFLALDWALSIATGFPWMGRLVKRGLVAYIAGEGISGMKRRIRAWKKHHHWTSGATGLHLLGTAPQLLHPEDVQALLVSLRTLPDAPMMVVIDTLARSMVGGDENTALDMGLAVAAAETIRAEFGCHVLVVHHKPAGASKTRGSTALPGAAQTVIRVSKDGNVMTLQCPKQKDYKEFMPMKYRLHSVELDERDPENNSLVLVPISAFDGDGDDSGAPVKLTRAAENVLEILKKSPGHAAQFMTIVNAMAAAPYRMAKSTTANALNLLQDARLAENTGTLWRLLE